MSAEAISEENLRDTAVPAKGLNLIIYPSSLVGASRVVKLSTSLQASGLFSSTHAVGVADGKLEASEQLALNTHIVRIAGSSKPGNLGRFLRTLLWQPRIFLLYRRQPVSAVAAESVSVLPLASMLAQRTGALLAYNPHELETETDAKTGLKRRLARWIEKRYIRRADVVSSVNDSIADWYEKTYHIAAPVVVRNVPIDDGSVPDLRQELGVGNNEMLYVHTGNLGPGRNIPLILREFSKRPQLHLVFIGDGPLSDLVDQAAVSFPNIHRKPPVGPHSVVGHVRSADVGLCLLETQNSLNMRLATPNKFFEALSANTPSLTSDMVEVRSILGDLASDWVLSDPDENLGPTLDRITGEDVARFRSTWNRALSWDDEVGPLVDAYRTAQSAKGS